MSSSDCSAEEERTVAGSVPQRAAADEASDVVSRLEHLAGAHMLSPEQVRAVVSAVTRLYAAASAAAGRELPPVGSDISTTDALTLACALVRSQDLTPFEMAVWFSRGQHAQ
jgi:hypothetical protein